MSSRRRWPPESDSHLRSQTSSRSSAVEQFLAALSRLLGGNAEQLGLRGDLEPGPGDAGGGAALGDIADAAPDADAGRVCRSQPATVASPSVGSRRVRQHLERRRLAGAVRAEKADDLAGARR